MFSIFRIWNLSFSRSFKVQAENKSIYAADNVGLPQLTINSRISAKFASLISSIRGHYNYVSMQLNRRLRDGNTVLYSYIRQTDFVCRMKEHSIIHSINQSIYWHRVLDNAYRAIGLKHSCYLKSFLYDTSCITRQLACMACCYSLGRIHTHTHTQARARLLYVWLMSTDSTVYTHCLLTPVISYLVRIRKGICLARSHTRHRLAIEHTRSRFTNLSQDHISRNFSNLVL